MRTVFFPNPALFFVSLVHFSIRSENKRKSSIKTFVRITAQRVVTWRWRAEGFLFEKHVLSFMTLTLAKKTAADIRALRVQGALNVALRAVESLKTVSDERELAEAIALLKLTRPTEPLLRNALHFVAWKTAPSRASVLSSSLKTAVSEFNAIARNALKNCSETAANRVRNGERVMVHCHSQTVVESLKLAWRQGKRFQGFVS